MPSPLTLDNHQIGSVLAALKHFLAQHIDTAEAHAIARLVLEETTGLSALRIALNPQYVLEDATIAHIIAIADKIADGMPAQYAIGHASFMGNDFKVTPATLIPRPETAALVDMITDRCKGRSDIRIMDIGTGSGCIAISLARALPFSQITATDISDDALAVATENARVLKVATQIDFVHADALTMQPTPNTYDVIVSNPPYVLLSERTDMLPHVLQYEPATALFVPDDDPLLFYRAIARYARTALSPGGALFFEINALMGQQMEQLLHSLSFDDINILRDYKGNIRYATACKN